MDKLINLCKKIDSCFDEIMEEARYLRLFYISTRYPGDFPEFYFDDAKKAFEAAMKIKNFVV